MLKSDGAGAWTLEEYRLLASHVAQQRRFRVGTRRLAVGLLASLAALGLLLPRLSAGVGPGPELVALGALVGVGAWLLELAHAVTQERAETRMRAIESALAVPGSRIGHDLRPRPRVGPAPSSPQLAHVTRGGAASLARSLAASAGTGAFYLAVLGAFAAWYALAPAPTPPPPPPPAPGVVERLEGLEAAVRGLPPRLDRIARGLEALPEVLAITPEPTPVFVDVHPPDLAPLLGSLEELREHLRAIEGGIRELERPTPEPTQPPEPRAPGAACEGRAWGIGSSSVSCRPE